MSFRRWIKRGLLGLAAVLAALLFGVLPYWLAGRITSSRARFNDVENAGLTPASFQLAFEEVGFQSADAVPLKGWWVPAENARGTAVLVHGLNRSRIEMVRKVPFLHALGWNALLFDQRGHGESGGTVRSLGYHEKDDVHAAIAYARTRSQQPVAVWGVSLGAVAGNLAAAEDPRVAAVVSDSSFRSLRDTAHHHLRLFRSFAWYLRVLPSGLLADEVLFWVGRRAGFDPDAIDVRAAAARLSGRPVLFVCTSGDQRMPPEIAFELKEAAGERAKVLVVPGVKHAHAWNDGKSAYEHAVEELLKEAVDGGPVRMAAR